MPSWEEWTKYLDAQEQAVEDSLDKAEEPQKPPTSQAVRPAPVTMPVTPRPSTPSKPVVGPSTTPVSPSIQRTIAKPAAPMTPPARPVETMVEETSEEAIVRKAARMRKRLPQQLADEPSASQEIAQHSYKSFRETREELLERLLDPQLSLEDTARILNVCPTTVRRYTNKGLLRHIRTAGNQRRFRLSDVLAFMETQSGIVDG